MSFISPYFRIDEGSEDEEDEEGWTKVSTGAVDKPKMFEKDAEINHELVIRKLKEIMAARGKKRTNRKEQIELLSELLEIAEEHNLGIGVSAKIKFDIIKAIFDYNPKISGKILFSSIEKGINMGLSEAAFGYL